jgi:hypothetical protein
MARVCAFGVQKCTPVKVPFRPLAFVLEDRRKVPDVHPAAAGRALQEVVRLARRLGADHLADDLAAPEDLRLCGRCARPFLTRRAERAISQLLSH